MFNINYIATLLAVMVVFMVIITVFASVCPTEVAQAQAVLAPLHEALDTVSIIVAQ